MNTWKCDGRYLDRLRLMRQQLGLLDLDFISCQEVFQTKDESYSTARYLAGALGMEAIWFPSRLKERVVEDQAHLSYSGLCVLTRHSPVEIHSLNLPFDPRDGDRTAQLLVFQLERFRIAVANTHLTHLKEAQHLRKQQLQKIVAELRDLQDLDTYIICGDLNADPVSEPIQFLNDSLPGIASVLEEPYPPTHVGGRTIDYIFFSAGGVFQLRNAEVVMNQPVDGLLPSDHFGVLAHFTTESSSQP